jgi:hypothetical protein
MLPVLMLADPVRLAAGDPTPADGGPQLGLDEATPIPGHMTFQELLQGLNPLHHIPVVGTIYRAVTGEQIQPVFRVLGGALFGGAIGALTGAAMAAIEEFRPVERLGMAFRGEPDPFLDPPPGSPPAVPRDQLLAAYGQVSYGGS